MKILDSKNRFKALSFVQNKFFPQKTNDISCSTSSYPSNCVDSKDKIRIIVTSNNDNILANLKEEGDHKGKVIRNLPIVNGFSVEVNPDTANEWLSPYIASGKDITIIKDKLFPINLHPQSPTGDLQRISTMARIKRFVGRVLNTPLNDSNGIFNQQQRPTTMETVGMNIVWAKGFTGKGVTIAFIDSGVYPHEDFKKRIVAFKDMDDSSKTAPYDKRGHGTHVAGLMIGDGTLSRGRMKGAAPGASLVAVKIKSELNGEEDESIAVSEAIAGLQWILDHKNQHNIKVVNLSLGVTPTTGWKQDLWAKAVEKVIAAGISVITVAGNENDPLYCRCITTPGIAPSAITVGAIDDQNTVDPSDDSIYYRSSRGPSIDGLPKPEVVAPGVNILSTLAPDSDFAKNNPKAKNYTNSTGTSQAAPIVTGLVATLLEANPRLKPAEIKEILVESARPLEDVDPNAQGAGVVFGPAALELALKKR